MEDKGSFLSPNWHGNDVLKASKLQRMSDATNRLIRIVNPPKSAKEQASPVGMQFQIVEVGADSITCLAFDGENTKGANIEVMKPYTLRVSTFDGKSINGVTYTYTDNVTRTADDGTNTETQKVTPDYTVGDTIIAFAAIRNFDEGTTLWQDMNVDGRAWAVDPNA